MLLNEEISDLALVIAKNNNIKQYNYTIAMQEPACSYIFVAKVDYYLLLLLISQCMLLAKTINLNFDTDSGLCYWL